jgi:anti-anti-sigma factor
MRIDEERVGGALVIAPAGRIDSVSSGELERLVVSRIDGGEKRLVLDLAGVEYISSAGLRVLLMAEAAQGPAGNLCGMGPGVRRARLAGFLPLRGRGRARAGARPHRGIDAA